MTDKPDPTPVKTILDNGALTAKRLINATSDLPQETRSDIMADALHLSLLLALTPSELRKTQGVHILVKFSDKHELYRKTRDAIRLMEPLPEFTPAEALSLACSLYETLLVHPVEDRTILLQDINTEMILGIAVGLSPRLLGTEQLRRMEVLKQQHLAAKHNISMS